MNPHSPWLVNFIKSGMLSQGSAPADTKREDLDYLLDIVYIGDFFAIVCYVREYCVRRTIDIICVIVC